ncbi:unnamed protein product [Parnassius apollo]|uniref:(apollo) hypothetical protein n=1 Tax=Parnassius apollo TaxID=110799 RepID=A0A8S3WM95_PARAO|nr:unnamed protein product [Parnassius apollo]
MPPLTAAQKQKRYKEKLKQVPEKYEEYKRKKRKTITQKKIRKRPKEKFNARFIWKMQKRAKQKNLNNIVNLIPPSSPLVLQEHNLNNNNQEDLPLHNNPQCHSPNLTKKERGKKKVKRNRSKLYKDNLKLRDEIEKFERKCNKYKKRYHRLRKLRKSNIQ